MNGEMMEYMVDRRGIPMDVLTRMKIEERLEFLPQTGKEEACICFPYLEDGVMKNMKFRDAAKHFKMVKGAELIPWNIDAIKGKEKCYITEGEIDALSLIAAGLEEVVSVPNGAGGANLQWLDRFVESHFDDKAEIILACLKTNSSHWKPYLWRKLPLKSGIPSQHQNKGTASRDSSHDAPLSTLWGTGGAARAAVPAYFPSASEYAYRQVCSPPRILPHSRCR